MVPMPLFLKRYVLSLLLLNLAACSTMQPVNIEYAMQSDKARGIDYGSLVEVKTLDRKTIKFRVTEITREGLGGNKGFYRYEDMKSLRVENPNSNKNDSALAWVASAKIGAERRSARIKSCPRRRPGRPRRRCA